MTNKYREMFVEEAHEHIQNLNHSLLELEKDPYSKDQLHNIFRAAHTIKGMAATMEYEQITHLCSSMEELLDKIRKSEVGLTRQHIDTLFKCFDLLEQMVDDENKKIDITQYLKELDFTKSSEYSPPKISTIRVKMEDLDALVNVVGELVIAKMALEQTTLSSSNESREALLAVSRLASEIKDKSMRLRLVPLDQVFNRFPRMIRDLANSHGKEIKFEIDDGGLELDRTALDAITDPLLHILRNSVDHGIETLEERIKNGKPQFGTIKLSAFRLGDKVAIRIDDDGRGIDVEKIKSMAVEKGILFREQSQIASDEEILELLGTPGLSTATSVTEVSGRGVGLNVVKKQLNRVSGDVKIETRKGLGTTITLIIPLSLAIIDGLIVSVGKERYVIPLSNVSNTLHVDLSEIKTVHGKKVITVRNKIIPLTIVSETLGINNKIRLDDKITIIVVEKGNRSYGLVVDSFERIQEIVIMRLKNPNLSSMFSNATILTDGNISLILEPEILI